MPTPKPLHLETDVNGALSLACQRAQVYADAARAASTRKLYVRAWRRWEAWCAEMHTAPLPAAPEAVAAYLGELARAGKSVATVRAALAAIQYYHRAAGHTLQREAGPIAAVLAGIVRTASRPLKRARALELERLRAIIAGITGEDLRALRDRALLLLGFFGALRRSELVALDASAAGRSFAEIRPEGLVLHLTATKASAATQSIYLPRRGDALCAASALERYLAAAGLAHGPLFRPVSKAGRLLIRRLNAASVRHILHERFGHDGISPHALRSGFITSAARRGVPEHVIQRTSRHKSVEVLRGYIREADGFAPCAARHL
jgi:site-specific recombinase XerD